MRKLKKKNVVDKIVAEAAYKSAERIASQSCMFFFYQPKLTDAVKKLRKF